jgi:hypothetical protein
MCARQVSGLFETGWVFVERSCNGGWIETSWVQDSERIHGESGSWFTKNPSFGAIELVEVTPIGQEFLVTKAAMRRRSLLILTEMPIRPGQSTMPCL